MMTFSYLGNRYKSLDLTLSPGTTDYSVCANNPDTFPDWNENWDERDYWTICVIKNLRSEGLNVELDVKFHDTSYDSITISKDDVPAIFEPFVFRDVFITNLDSDYSVSFDITFFNNRTITPPPYKPENLEAIEVESSYVTLQFNDPTLKNDSFDEKYFRIERSSTSSTEGFSQIDTATGTSLRFQNQYETIQYTDNTVSSGITYWYKVRSYNDDGGNSPYSNVVEVSVP
jgi:hypothetical protein